MTTAGRTLVRRRDFWSDAVQLILPHFDALIINDRRGWYGGWLLKDYFLMYHIAKKQWISKKENGSNYSIVWSHLGWLVNWTCWAWCVHFSMDNCKMTYRKTAFTFTQWGLLFGRRRHRRKLRILKYKQQAWACGVSWWLRVEEYLRKETLNNSRKSNCLFIHPYHMDAASSYSTSMFKKSVWKWQRKQPRVKFRG